MSELTIEQRVAAGAAWLDENQPGWMDRIFLESLDVSVCTLCVLGQVFGEYGAAPYQARWFVAPGTYATGGYAAGVRGFNSIDGNSYDSEEFEALTAEWRRLIESRRAEVE